MQFDALTRYLDSLPEKGVPGCDLAVWKDHHPIYRHVAGERAPGLPMDGTETYWFYSCSKVFTMTAVMQLVERGLLLLSDPVADYLPAYAHLTVDDSGEIRPARTVLTLEHLMTMQGGLSYDLTMPAVRRCLEKNPCATTRELVDAFAEQSLLFDPGTRFRYSLCHDVAAAVVEVASGQSYGDYLSEHLFAPLGMRAMTFAPDAPHFARMAARYHWDADGRPIPEDNTVNPYRLSPAYESGGAGLSGDVDSFILLADALANGGVGRTGAHILTEASIDDMRTNRLSGASRVDFSATGKVGYGYGLGVRTLTDAASSRSPLGEFGWDGAAGAWLMADPEHHLAAFYAQHVMCCGRAFDEFHPAIRDLIYEGVNA